MIPSQVINHLIMMIMFQQIKGCRTIKNTQVRTVGYRIIYIYLSFLKKKKSNTVNK